MIQKVRAKTMRFKDITDSLDMIKYDDQCIQENIIYVKPGTYAMSSRKIESLVKIAYMQKYYQCNPVRFINDFFNIELLDAQAWIVQQSWTCPNVLLVCSRGFGKSTLIDIIIMSKDMLFNNYWTYIASGSGSQAEQTFTTLERLANDNIDTMMGSTGYIFKAEIEIKNAAGDGLIKDPLYSNVYWKLSQIMGSPEMDNHEGNVIVLHPATITA